MRRPDELTDDQRHQLQQILDRSEDIAAAHRLAAAFAHLLRQRRGADLETWAHQAEACDVREIRSFATTLRQDRDAVVAGLTLSHSNGATDAVPACCRAGSSPGLPNCGRTRLCC